MKKYIAVAFATLAAASTYAAEPPELQIQRDAFKAERNLNQIYGADIVAYCQYRWHISGLAATLIACLDSYGTKAQREASAKHDAAILAARQRLKQAELDMDNQYGPRIGAYCRSRWMDSKNHHVNVPALQACLDAKGM